MILAKGGSKWEKVQGGMVPVGSGNGDGSCWEWGGKEDTNDMGETLHSVTASSESRNLHYKVKKVTLALRCPSRLCIITPQLNTTQHIQSLLPAALNYSQAL